MYICTIYNLVFIYILSIQAILNYKLKHLNTHHMFVSNILYRNKLVVFF